jgi:hypothetical protein
MVYVYTPTRLQDFVFYPVIIVQIDFLYYNFKVKNGLWNYKTIYMYMDSFSRNCDNCRKKIPPPQNVKKNEFIGCHQESDYTGH